MNPQESPYVDLVFQVFGKSVPADHAYILYSAVSRSLPAVHSRTDVLIKTLPGVLSGTGRLTLAPTARLRIRMPVDAISLIYPLAGKTIELGADKVRIGIPQIYPLKAYKALYSRMVVIKGFMDPEPFVEAAERQLQAANIAGTATLYPDERAARRILGIKQRNVVGFGVRVSNLSEEDSIKLQAIGLGGKKKMGCGFFLPERMRT